MAIGDGLPVIFSNVCLEIYGSANTLGKTLSQAFIDATGTFDAAYEGVKDRLLNFRNYDHTGAGLTLFSSTAGFGTAGAACSASTVNSYYHNGIGSFPANNDVIYTDSGGTTVLDGGGNYYSFGLSSFIVNSIGKVSSISSCL